MSLVFLVNMYIYRLWGPCSLTRSFFDSLVAQISGLLRLLPWPIFARIFRHLLSFCWSYFFFLLELYKDMFAHPSFPIPTYLSFIHLYKFYQTPEESQPTFPLPSLFMLLATFSFSHFWWDSFPTLDHSYSIFCIFSFFKICHPK